MAKHPFEKYRDEHKLSQKQLAKKLKTSKPNISRIENGLQDVSDKMLPLAVKTLGIPARLLRPDLAELFEIAA